MTKKSLLQNIIITYKIMSNDWMCADDIRDLLKKVHFVKSESVARCIRKNRQMFEEIRIKNYKKFRLSMNVYASQCLI